MAARSPLPATALPCRISTSPPRTARHAHRLTDGRQSCIRGECFLSPSWAPDGKHIAYIAEAHYSSDLQVMRPDGSQAKKFADGGIEEDGLGFAIGGPSWGPAPR